MDNRKLKQILSKRLENKDRKINYDREKATLRIEHLSTGKGITISLAGIVAKWHDRTTAREKNAVIDEVVYYVEHGLTAMEEKIQFQGRERDIYPVIRSTSFPEQTAAETKLLFDEHTAETRIYYAIDLGNTYRLIDEKLLNCAGWTKEQIRETALFNVRSLPVNFKEDIVSDNIFYFLNTKDGYDASRILNTQLLEQMADQIEGTMAVAVPHQDVLIVADLRNDTGYDILAQMTMSFFADGNIPITALSFIYEQEKLEPIFILGKNKRRD